MELQPGEKAAMSLTLPKGLFFIAPSDPPRHPCHAFPRGRGDEDQPVNAAGSLSVVLADAHVHFGSTTLQP